MSAAIELQDVACKLGHFQLGPLNFQIPRGAVLAFIGPNGAGKTTTLDLLMGLGRADSGVIRLLDRAQPKDEVAIKARVAYVNPDMNFLIWGTVGRALDFVRGFYPDWSEARCERLLAEFEMKRGDKLSALSFGSRTKLLLIMALARDAEILILDEPTIGLDVNARLKLFGEILDFMKREERTVIISSHQLAELERLADHVAILDKGRLLTIGRMDELVERYVCIDGRTVGAMPALDGFRLLSREGERVRLLYDRNSAALGGLGAYGIEILAETPMSLEEVFVALTAA